jgi:hypothetical protein
LALTAGTATDVVGVLAGVSCVLVAPTVMPELVTTAGAAGSWPIARVSAPAATTALPPTTAASILTLIGLFAFTDCSVCVDAGSSGELANVQETDSECDETVKPLDCGCELARRAARRSPGPLLRRRYGAAGGCSSLGSGAGPFRTGAAIVVASTVDGVVNVDVAPIVIVVDLAALAAPASCSTITDTAPMATRALPPMTAASVLTLLGFAESMPKTPHFMMFFLQATVSQRPKP